MSTILHGTWLLGFVIAVPFLLRTIPVSSLAAVLVFTGFKLVNLQNVKHLQRYGRMPVFIYAATVLGIVVFDLLTGVIAGIVLSLLKLLYKVSQFLPRLELHQGNRADLYLEGAATFIRLPALARELDRIPPGTQLHVHCDRLVYIDHSCLDLLGAWQAQHAETGSTLHVEWDHLFDKFRQPMTADLRAAPAPN